MNDTPTIDTEITGGWLRATRHSLGMSIDQFARVLDVQATTLRQKWEFGGVRIPDGVRDDVRKFVQLTDAVVETLRGKAELLEEPAIIVYHERSQLPDGHIAATYGLEWWDNIAASVARLDPDVIIGFPWEIAAAYGYDPTHAGDVHADPAVIAIYSQATTSAASLA